MSASDAKMIKSAQRALQVLEFFDAAHPQATVMEIARRLGYPQSSTSELLRCLVGLGYLEYDRYKRLYEPTARVPLLGAWVQPSLFRCGRLLPMLDQISRATRQTVTLSSVVGMSVQCIHVIAPPDAGESIAPGSMRSLLHSSCGRLFMSRYLEKRVRALLHRINAEEQDPRRHVRFEALCDELKNIRARGYASELGEFDPDIGAIHMLLTHTDGQTLAVGLTGSAEDFRGDANEFIAIMRNSMRQAPSARPASQDFPRPTIPNADGAGFERRFAMA